MQTQDYVDPVLCNYGWFSTCVIFWINSAIKSTWFMSFTVFITKIWWVHSVYYNNMSGDFINKRMNSTTFMTEVSIQVHNFLKNNTYQLPSAMFNRLFQKIQNISQDQKIQVLLPRRHCLYNFINSICIFLMSSVIDKMIEDIKH